jgi:hypothetical protein
MSSARRHLNGQCVAGIVALIFFASHDLSKLDEKVQNAIIGFDFEEKLRRNENFGP